MAVIRRRSSDETPSEAVAGGDAGASSPLAPADRTKSAVAGRNTAASLAGRAPATPRVPGVRTGAAQQQSGPTDAKSFINDTQAELKRVVWPTQDEVRNGTIVTVGLLIFFAAYIWGLDVLARELFIVLGLCESKI